MKEERKYCIDCNRWLMVEVSGKCMRCRKKVFGFDIVVDDTLKENEWYLSHGKKQIKLL